MTVASFFFYLFAALTLAFGVLTVTTHKLFRSAIYLLFTLTNISALYFTLHYEFIAAVQIIVYVGGIVVLILFSLFLTQQAGVHLSKPSFRQVVFSLLASAAGFGFVWSVLVSEQFTGEASSATEYQVAQIGKQMLSTGRDGYMLPFEAVSILLLAAMIGCIAIAVKQEPSKAESNGQEQTVEKAYAVRPQPQKGVEA